MNLYYRIKLHKRYKSIPNNSMSLLELLNSHACDTNNEIEVRFKLNDPIQSSIIQQYMSGKGKESRHVTWEFLNDTGSRIVRTGVSSISPSDILTVLPSLQTGVYTHENKTLIGSDVLTLGGVYMKVSNSVETVLGDIEYSAYNQTPATLFRHKNRLTYTCDTRIKVDITKIYSVILGTNKVSMTTEVEIEMLPGYTEYTALIVSFIHDIINLAMIPAAVLNKSNASRITGKLNYTNERVSGMIINSIITKPVSFMRSHLTQLFSSKYAVSYKADGVRCILIVMPFCDTTVCIMLTADTIRFVSRVPDTTQRDQPPDIYDAELCGDTIYIFDVIRDEEYDVRIQYIQTFIDTHAHTQFSAANSLTLIAKPVSLGSGVYTGTQLSSLQHLENDGVIFTPIAGGYYTEVLKWKPTHQNTIDLKVTFYRHRPAQREIHIGLSGPRPVEPSEVAFNNKHRNIVITQLPLEELILGINVSVGSIVECAYNEDLSAFIPIKKRTDKVIPNGWGVISDAITLIKDNVAFDELTRVSLSAPVPSNVAVEYSPDLYNIASNYNDAGRNYEVVMNNRIRMFHNYVKKSLFDAYSAHRKDISVADICCGQGSALKWVISSAVKKVLLVDSSEKMLENALQRAAQFNVSNKTDILHELLDMRVSSVTGNSKYDIVQCHFAIQYFFESASALDNIISSVSNMMHTDSHFIGIMPDGDVLNTKLLSGGGLFEAHTDQTDYKIVAHYGNYNSRDPVTAFNRKISVYLKESILDTITDIGVCEYLASFKILLECCKRHNMTLVETAILRHPYKVYLDGLKYKDPRVFTDVDHAFSYTYRYFVFAKSASSPDTSFDKGSMPAPFRKISQRLSVTRTLDHNNLIGMLTSIFQKKDNTVTPECIQAVLHTTQQTDAEVMLALGKYFNCGVCVLYQKRAVALHKKSFNEHRGITGVIVLIEYTHNTFLVVKCDNSMIWDPTDYPYKLT